MGIVCFTSVVSIKYFCHHVKHSGQRTVALNVLSMNEKKSRRKGKGDIPTQMIVSKVHPYLIVHYSYFSFRVLEFC